MTPERAGDSLARVLGMAAEAVDVVVADPDLAGDLIKMVKPIGEAALLLYAAAPAVARQPRLRAPFEALQRVVAAHARTTRMETAIRFRPAAAAELAVPHLCLAALGTPDERLSRALADALASPVATMRERVPWKKQEGWWIARLAGSDAPPPLLDETLVGWGVDALGASRGELYGFTHALIYAADFGRRRPNLPRAAAAIGADAESALVRVLEQDDFDLAAELLFTWPYLGLPWSDAAGFALDLLFEVEGEIGFLPSLSLRKQAFEEQPEEARRRWFFKEAYHTDFVMGMLTAALIAADHFPAAAYALAKPRLLPALDALLSGSATTPQWALPRTGQTPPLSFRLTAAVHRHARDVDLPRLREAVLLAVDEGCADLPAVQQSLDMLVRLAG
jgi:hypothetical protein